MEAMAPPPGAMGDEEMVMDGYGRNYVPGALLGTMGQNWQNAPMVSEDAARARLAFEQERASELFRMQRIAYQQALRRARPIIAQWSEWERQARMEAWR
jgi:hypothetical protein